MKHTLIALGACILMPLALLCQSKVALTPSMITNLTTKGDATLLIDEQALAGDPKNGSNSAPTTYFFGGYNDMYYPLRVMIDLQALYSLDEIYYFDSHNKDSLKIYTGKPYNWTLSSTVWLGTFNKWQSSSLNTKSRYIMLEFPSNAAKITEIVLYGTRLTNPVQVPAPTEHPYPLMEDFIGANVLHNQPIDKLKCVGSIREYHPWQWDEGDADTTYKGYPNSEFAWSPSWVSGPGWGWNFDDTYAAFKKAGFDVSPCLQQTPLYLLEGSKNVDKKPVLSHEDPTDPFSYEEHSRYLYQFTARYGSIPVSPSKLMLKANQPVKSGLDMVKYVENWNEQDKWWRGREGYFSPDEMAAMCSADYDGHEGALGPGFGVKNADPNIKMAMGGLAGLSLEYIKGMKLWSDFHRSTGFPADVLNFHHYSNISGGQDGVMRVALSPEEDSLKHKLREIAEYRDRYIPGTEIWVSEFGYDTNPKSVQGCQPIGQNDVYEVQAQWLIRSYLEMAAAGVDRAHMFFFADMNSNNPNKFNSMGLVNEKWNRYQPKTSWYYVYAMKNALTGYRFHSELPSGNPSVNLYKFFNEKTETYIYAAWCTTSTDQRIQNFTVDLRGALGATLMELNHGDTVALESPLAINQHGQAQVNLSERPIFIRTVGPNSTSCIEMNAKNSITVFLDKSGHASITPQDVDNGTKANCGPISLSISKSSFNCSEVSYGNYVEIASDASWMQSTDDLQANCASFPWTGANGQLPPASTFSIPVSLGQPKSYHSIDSVDGSNVIKSPRHVTFYRKTFVLHNLNTKELFAEMTVDDDMEIYLNGHLIAREESHEGSSAVLPAHRLESNSPLQPTYGEQFDFVDSDPAQYLKTGQNEIILAIRNKKNNDNGGFSFRMGVGNPSAHGVKTTLTATDNYTQAQDTGSTMVNVIDILPPSFDLKTNPRAYLGSNGKASLTMADVSNSIYDNCQVAEMDFFPKEISFTDVLNGGVIEVVSDSTWVKSTFVDTKSSFSYPWAGVPELPDSTTYSLPAISGQPTNLKGFYEVPGSKLIGTDSYVTFYKKSFDLNVDSIKECLIELTVNDDVEVYINGELLARESSFSGANASAPAHCLYYNNGVPTNGHNGGDAFDHVSLSTPTSLLNLNGSNEIVLAVRNGGNNNVGGFSFKLSIPVVGKYNYPVKIMAVDKSGNFNTAYTAVEVIDTIAPVVIASSPLLVPDSTGMLNLDAAMFNNGSYDNASIESLSIYPGSVSCSNPQAVSFTAMDYFGNTSTETVALSVLTSACNSGSVSRKASSAANEQPSNNMGWEFTAYPLPAGDELTIEMINFISDEDIRLEVWDITGRLLISKVGNGGSIQKLDLSSLASGEYLLKLTHNQQQKTTKLMVH